MKTRVMSILGVLLAISMLLTACAPQTVVVTKEVVGDTVQETVVVQETKIVESTKIVEVVVTPTPVPTTRTGAWVDAIIFTSQDSAEAAVTQLLAGELDIYAYSVNSASLFTKVSENADLGSTNAYGSYNEITFNTAEFTEGLNPFTNPKIREALNWLMDRNYIAQEIYGGLAMPKLFCLNSAFPDYANFIDTARKLEAKYAYNPEKANEIITAEMEAMGATKVDNVWNFNGAPLTIKILIRTEDERRQIGDYIGTQLESIGFAADRQYKTRSEASPIWVQGNPADGLFHIYTGGWVTTAVSRDDATNFGFFYLPDYYPIPLWQAYKNTPEFTEIANKLYNNDFTSLEERGELFAQAMELSLEDSTRVWLVDQLSYSPMRSNVQVAYDLAGGVAGSQLYPYTVRFAGQEGGTMRIAQPGVLVDPWNPVAGSNWVYDTMPIRATGDLAVVSDPYTGLAWPNKIEKAEVLVKEGLPVGKSLDWVDLQFAAEIEVPGDAWADWDAVNQKFITVSEKYTDTVTTLRKSTVYYPADLWDTVTWHDGSPLTVGDFVMAMILNFDTGKPESPIFDDAQAGALESYMTHFKGVKIVSTDPLVIETYDDLYGLDAENSITSWWPYYAYGPGAWHNIGLGVSAEVSGTLAFSSDKADAKGIEWMSYIAGPSLEILKGILDASTVENYIPYAPTMSEYVTAEEATARYANLNAWYESKGHFWLGTGPFYLYKVFPVEQTVMLQRFAAYPDLANKWARFGEPAIAVVEVDGPGQVTIGSEAKFDVYVTFKDAPYPAKDIAKVKFLVFNAKGELVGTGDAVLVEDGKYQVILTPELTKLLEAGANKLEIAVSPLVVSIPSFGVFEFVTVP